MKQYWYLSIPLIFVVILITAIFNIPVFEYFGSNKLEENIVVMEEKPAVNMEEVKDESYFDEREIQRCEFCPIDQLPSTEVICEGGILTNQRPIYDKEDNCYCEQIQYCKTD